MLQIIGRKDNNDYRKAVRYCKEHRIPFQEVNTKDYKLSKRELDSIFSSLSNPDDAIDKSSAYYKKNGYEWREYNAREEVEEHVELLVNPILRNKNKIALGFDEAFLKGERTLIHYCILSTGSCGNSYVFYDGETSVVVDMGVTYTKFVTQLEQHGITLSSVKAVFLTHLHPDHVKGVGAVQRKMGVPVYLSSTAYHNGKSEIMKQKIDKDSLIHFEWGERIDVAGASVTSFAVSHDSPGASGFSISFSSSSFFILTDTGIIPDEAYSYASSSSVKFIEANYDEDMLLSGPYPEWLKKRISGPYGHLSNTMAVEFAARVSRRGDQIYFVHPSENNNKTALLKEKAEKRIESGIFLKCCERGEMFEGFID